MKLNYKIKEEGTDALSTVVSKTGGEVTFTPQDMLNDQQKCERYLKELGTKLEIETAKAENIETFHPFVKELTEEQLFTVGMYNECKEVMKLYPPKIKEIEAVYEESKAEMKLIETVLGLDFSTAVVEKQVEEITS